MPTENKPAEPFQRENRYIVIKRSDVDTFWRDDVREQFMSSLERLNEHHVRIPQRQFLVIESDWPEYEPAWHMIEQRVNGVADTLPEVVAVINEEGEHFKETVVEHRPGIDRLPVGTELVDRAHVIRLQAERDALQLRLNAADQRIDELTAQQAESRMITLSGCEFSEHELISTAVRMVTGTSRRGTQRWVAMKDAFCCGSGVAHALCRRFGFDPDEMVKP